MAKTNRAIGERLLSQDFRESPWSDLRRQAPFCSTVSKDSGDRLEESLPCGRDAMTETHCHSFTNYPMVCH
jgi:hypothetical protein